MGCGTLSAGSRPLPPVSDSYCATYIRQFCYQEDAKVGGTKSFKQRTLANEKTFRAKCPVEYAKGCRR
jgi:hypothetical protein